MSDFLASDLIALSQDNVAQLSIFYASVCKRDRWKTAYDYLVDLVMGGKIIFRSSHDLEGNTIVTLRCNKALGIYGNTHAKDREIFRSDSYVFANFGNCEGDPAFGPYIFEIHEKPSLITIGDWIDVYEDETDLDAIKFSILASCHIPEFLPIRLLVELAAIDGVDEFLKACSLVDGLSQRWNKLRSIVGKNVQALYSTDVQGYRSTLSQ